ncbi:hypothetical protein [Lachnobacterium bovis]|uniref:hypothetical protein n=1 Tax=Lachnobacterium bovis TaxID=140626 RepID=UPI000489635C|nr:hypothetical protein [Lachnobacterium bovis]
MKKFFKHLCIGISIPIVTLCFSSLVFAWSATTLDHGNAKWEGGESKNSYLYSRVMDLKRDGIRYHATVWVKCDNGSYNYKEGKTTDLGSNGWIQVRKKASHTNPFVSEKAGYKDFGRVK